MIMMGESIRQIWVNGCTCFCIMQSNSPRVSLAQSIFNRQIDTISSMKLIRHAADVCIYKRKVMTLFDCVWLHVCVNRLHVLLTEIFLYHYHDYDMLTCLGI